MHHSNLLYRIACLITYIIVILFIDSFISLFLLFLLFCISICGRLTFKSIIFLLINFLVMLYGFFTHQYLVFRIVLLIDYIYYFLIEKKGLDNSILEKNKQIGEMNYDIICFSYERENIFLYLIFYFGLLLFIIMVG